ncbi:MAG: tetratricopeptide repeat protein [Coprococcus sp.]|nr:tetratricopeptide repeat protein [Coprococcus sp.]
MADVLNCKHCGGTIQVTGYCANCGLKSEYVNKALNSSKYYYNIGLDKARVRDMSGAKEALKTALKYDKMNIDARNLLGLVYYETGEVVMALSHWVVSVNHFSGRNVAKRYIKDVRSNPHKLEATNNVARKYNQALAYARQGSKDLAFIQLRKVLSDNNKFVNGYLLLALLFIDEERFDKARKALKRVIKIDRTNPLAVRYLSEMGHTDEEIMRFRDFPEESYDADLLFVDEERKAYSGTGNVDFDGEPIPVGRYKDINFYKYSLAYIIAGLILGIAVTWFLIVPHRDKTADDESRNLKIAFSQEIADKNVKMASLENEIESLNTELDDANKQVTNLNKKIKAYETSAAQILSDEDRVRMQSGIKKYEDMSYDEAISDFDKVLEHNPDSDIALYYKGMSYIKKSDTINAKQAFNKLVSKCPDSLYYTIAASYADADVVDAADANTQNDNRTGNDGTVPEGNQTGNDGTIPEGNQTGNDGTVPEGNQTGNDGTVPEDN